MSAGKRARVELATDGTVGSETGYYYHKAEHAQARALVNTAAEIRARIATDEARLDVIVQDLRTIGCSWAVIGAALGTTKAAAFKRYAHRELTSH